MKEHDLLLEEFALGFDNQKSWDDRIPPENYSSTKYAIGAVGLWYCFSSDCPQRPLTSLIGEK